MANSLLDARTQAYNLGLFIGVGQRPDDPPTFRVTAEDASKLSKVFQKGLGLVQEQNNILLKDADAITDKIFEKLVELEKTTQIKKADTVFVYFSGHGYFFENEFYLITRDSTLTNYTYKAISGKRFSQYLKKIACEKMLIILDCCHSGGFNGKGTGNEKPHGINPEYFMDMPNRVILSACGRGQVSYLTQPISLFTYAFIETLGGKFLGKDENEIKLFSLAMGVRERVTYLSGNIFYDGRAVQKPELDVLEESKTGNFTLKSYSKIGAQEVRFLNEEIKRIVSEDNKVVSIFSEDEKIEKSLFELDNDWEISEDKEAKAKLDWLVNIKINQNFGISAGRDVNIGRDLNVSSFGKQSREDAKGKEEISDNSLEKDEISNETNLLNKNPFIGDKGKKNEPSYQVHKTLEQNLGISTGRDFNADKVNFNIYHGQTDGRDAEKIKIKDKIMKRWVNEFNKSELDKLEREINRDNDKLD